MQGFASGSVWGGGVGKWEGGGQPPCLLEEVENTPDSMAGLQQSCCQPLRRPTGTREGVAT